MFSSGFETLTLDGPPRRGEEGAGEERTQDVGVPQQVGPSAPCPTHLTSNRAQNSGTDGF